MGHSHHHHHAHPHPHHGTSAHKEDMKRLVWVLALTILYMLVEVAGGLYSNSLALLADAAHMLTDAGTLGLALFAAWFSQHPASAQKTYGYYRLEIFAAFLNGLLLVAVSGYVFYEAFGRLFHPTQVQAPVLMAVAAGGLLINLVSGALLFRASQHNLNMRAAFLHIMSDCLGSAGAVVAGVLILTLHWLIADAAFSIVIAILVLVSAWGLLQEAVNILLEACPVHLSIGDIEQALRDFEAVHAVHDLHVWSISSGKDALSAHVVVHDLAHYTPHLLSQIRDVLKERFHLSHVTIQLETTDFREESVCF